MAPGHVAVGRVLAPHGLRGETKVEPLTAQPEHFAVGRTLWTGEAAHEVEASRGQKGFIFLKLVDVTSVEAAEALRGCLLSLPESEMAPLPEDEYYAYQLIGLDVYDATGERLGQVVRLLATGSNDVYVVGGPYGELLVPAIEDVIVEVDVPGGRMVVSLMDGMLRGDRE
jgi:16S rRNA processing protein RimM